MNLIKIAIQRPPEILNNNNIYHQKIQNSKNFTTKDNNCNAGFPSAIFLTEIIPKLENDLIRLTNFRLEFDLSVKSGKIAAICILIFG